MTSRPCGVAWPTRPERCGGSSARSELTIPVFTHPACLKHDPGPDHPETPARLSVLLARIRQERGLELREASPADRRELLAVHPDQYLSSLEAMSARGGGALFLDTILNRDS